MSRTPAENASLYAALQNAEHALLSYPTCAPGLGACPSCEDRFEADYRASADFYAAQDAEDYALNAPFGGGGHFGSEVGGPRF